MTALIVLQSQLAEPEAMAVQSASAGWSTCSFSVSVPEQLDHPLHPSLPPSSHSVSLSVSLSVCLIVCVSLCLSLSVCLSVCLPVCLCWPGCSSHAEQSVLVYTVYGTFVVCLLALFPADSAKARRVTHCWVREKLACAAIPH